MISRRDVIRELDRKKGVADWVVVEREQELATVDERRPVTRSEQRTRLSLIVRVDRPLGRGSTLLELDATEGDAGAIVEQAIQLASAAIGPTWRSVPPAAPASVDVLDPALGDDANLADAARAIAKTTTVKGASVKTRCTILRETVAVQAHSGFHDEWSASTYRTESSIAVGKRSLEIVRAARRAADLGLVEAIDEAAGDLRALGRATTPPAISHGEPLDLVLATDAMLHGAGLGVWSVFAVQADSTLERQGLTRYRPGNPIAPGAPQVPDPLTITSDGAIDFALESSPVSEDGDAIRRFALVERGVCRGLALTMREAALRGRDPNGGVRNLVIEPGAWNGALPRRTLEIRRLRALSIDHYTGDASLEIALAIDHDGEAHRPFAGGTVRVDLIAALARAKRRAALVPLSRGAYVGPPSVLIENIELVA